MIVNLIHIVEQKGKIDDGELFHQRLQDARIIVVKSTEPRWTDGST